MSSTFLIGLRGNAQLWACVDDLTLCTSPTVAERRFTAYLAPFCLPVDARQALIEAGADPASITDEVRPRRRRGR